MKKLNKYLYKLVEIESRLYDEDSNLIDKKINNDYINYAGAQIKLITYKTLTNINQIEYIFNYEYPFICINTPLNRHYYSATLLKVPALKNPLKYAYNHLYHIQPQYINLFKQNKKIDIDSPVACKKREMILDLYRNKEYAYAN